MKKIISISSIILLLLGVGVASYFLVGNASKPETITWGVDFSQSQAEAMGLNWKDAYSAIISDLGVKHIKIHTQWDIIQANKANYNFADTDWQLSQAKDNNVKIIYVLGMKSGRWPECHIPDWAKDLSKEEMQNKLLEYTKAVVLRYKDNTAITYWQVENEPLFQFGVCPDWYYADKTFLPREVALVKSLDSSRQIIISDSGESSLWFGAAKIGDIVGTTMYREVWAHISNNVGFFFHYFMSPVFYERKALLIEKFFGKKVICIELQAEPWASKPFYEIPLEEQERTMNLEIFKNNVIYAKNTGLDTFYFWGVEWWYWLKEVKNKPEIWNEAKNLF